MNFFRILVLAFFVFLTDCRISMDTPTMQEVCLLVDNEAVRRITASLIDETGMSPEMAHTYARAFEVAAAAYLQKPRGGLFARTTMNSGFADNPIEPESQELAPLRRRRPNGHKHS